MLAQNTVNSVRVRVSSTYVLAALVVLSVACHGPLARAVGSSARLQTAVTIFAGVFVQAVPFLALGVTVSGAIAAFVSPALLRKMLPRNETAAIGVAGIAGMALPGCECGVVPVALRLSEQGAPGSVALAFMLSAPAINPVVLIATAVAFPGEPAMVVARFTGSLTTAFYPIQRAAPHTPPILEPTMAAHPPLPLRMLCHHMRTDRVIDLLTPPPHRVLDLIMGPLTPHRRTAEQIPAHPGPAGRGDPEPRVSTPEPIVAGHAVVVTHNSTRSY
ncbi:permease [Nocardia sp. NPDC004711]